MKNLIMRRGSGKTTRLLALSEFYSAPIICATVDQRQNILNLALRCGYSIPTPVTVQDLLAGKFKSDRAFHSFLIDESQDVLCGLVSSLTNAGQILGMTTTDTRGAAYQ